MAKLYEKYEALFQELVLSASDKQFTYSKKPCIGAMMFFALQHKDEMCGSNGLPLTPNSITILGRSQILKTLKHEGIAQHLDLLRGKHEKLIIVFEYWNYSLSNIIESGVSVEQIKDLACQILSALAYLNKRDIVHRCVSPENILYNKDTKRIKLYNYGIYYITDCGRDVTFPIGTPKYMSPEVLVQGLNKDYVSGPKVDVWSVGIILTELALGRILWKELNLSQSIRKILSLIRGDPENILERIAREQDHLETYKTLPEDLKDFINQCLRIDLETRPSPQLLLDHPFLSGTHEDQCPVESPQGRQLLLNSRPLDEIYHLWQLAGGDVQKEMKKEGLNRFKPPFLTTLKIVTREGQWIGETKDDNMRYDCRVVSLPMDSLIERLAHIPPSAYFPLFESEYPVKRCLDKDRETASPLPLIIRERDTEYQFHRIVQLSRLIEAYPYPKVMSQLIKEAKIDIPPFLRHKVWSILLNVKGNVEDNYARIDKQKWTPTDRQIDVDIPRCHQYNELLSSKTGHTKLKRVLKAWVTSHPQFVYWQGLDSLCAPFVFLNFNDEATAYACFSTFIPKYLHNFFLRDNSAVVREYLSKFSHLIAFHDAELANHMSEINFIPELFAIPWFLTMFSHVLPLHKIFHLWDKLLLGDASFPLFIGVSILKQLRETLLSSGFNECILLFSDLPEVDIEQSVTDSIDIYCVTPRSITFRMHESESTLLEGALLQRHNQALSEFCSSLSSTDLLDLINTRFKKPKVLVIDIRDNEEYVAESIIGSINIPLARIPDLESTDLGSMESSPEMNILFNNKGSIIVIVGGEDSMRQAKFARFIVRLGFPKVTYVHEHVNSFECYGVLGPGIPS
ncbi:hypothetical protein M8J77_006460 [Diaphorina citri]|nr:hypothetical protein M8J77_006460 [Diaphorina citri]